MVNCPFCGKATFKKKFCIFCGKGLETRQNEKSDEKAPKVHEIERNNVGSFQKRLENLLELRNRFEKGVTEFETEWRQYKSGLEKDLARYEKDKIDAKKGLEELEVLYGLEEISEDDYKAKSDALNQRLMQNEKEIENTRSQIKELEKLGKKLSKSAKVGEIKKRKTRSKKSAQKKLAKLKLAYKNGKIGNGLFEKLKAKYEEEIKG